MKFCTIKIIVTDGETVALVTAGGNFDFSIVYNSPWDGFIGQEEGTAKILMLPGGIFFGGDSYEDDFWISAGIKKSSS